MSENYFENNVAILSGVVSSEPTYSHEVYGEGFYLFNLSILRLSDSYDVIPVLVSERLVDISQVKIDAKVKVEGQYRSYNTRDDSSRRLLLVLFAREFDFVEQEAFKFINSIELNAFICKKPVYRTTPSGREIADLLVAVNRSYNKSDYLPCIAWGRNARFANSLSIGDKIKLHGRIQSREYNKQMPDGQIKVKTAYEVSVSKLMHFSEAE